MQALAVDAAWPLALWLVDLSTEPLLAEMAVLSAAERERAARFHFARDRRRYLAAHVRLRQVLSRRTGVVPHALRFTIGPHGKPALAGQQAGCCTFNLSHSGDTAVIGVADGTEIGVDVEILRPVPDADDLALRLYTPVEREELRVAGEHGRDMAFLGVWTRKEACLKAVGCGLSVEPASFEAGSSGALRAVTLGSPVGPAVVDVVSVNAGDTLVAAAAWMRIPGRRAVAACTPHGEAMPRPAP